MCVRSKVPKKMMKQKVKNALRFTRRNTKKHTEEAKKQWFIIGKYLMKGGKIEKYHNSSKLTARRTCIYYYDQDLWEGPSPRQLGKMNEEEFMRVLRRREQSKRGTLLENEVTTPDIWDIDVPLMTEQREEQLPEVIDLAPQEAQWSTSDQWMWELCTTLDEGSV